MILRLSDGVTGHGVLGNHGSKELTFIIIQSGKFLRADHGEGREAIAIGRHCRSKAMASSVFLAVTKGIIILAGLWLVPGCGVMDLIGGALEAAHDLNDGSASALEQAQVLDWQDGEGTVDGRIDHWGQDDIYEIPGAKQGDRLSFTLESLPSTGSVLVPVLAVLDDQGEVVEVVGVHNLNLPEVWEEATTHRFPPGDHSLPPPQNLVHIVRRDTPRFFLVVYHAQTLWFCGPYRLTARILNGQGQVSLPRKRTVAVNFDGAAAVDASMYPELLDSTLALDPWDIQQIVPPGMENRREDLIELILAWVAVYFDRYDITVVRATPVNLASADVVVHIVNPGTLDQIGFFKARGVELSIGREDRQGVALVQSDFYASEDASTALRFTPDQNTTFDIGRYTQLRDVLEPIARNTGKITAHEIGHTLGLLHVDTGLMQWNGKGKTFDHGQIQIGGTYAEGLLEVVTIPGARQDGDRWLAERVGRVVNPEPRQRLARLTGYSP